MAYLPLYRKYRPKNLQEIVGQEHIKHALKSAIELGKISHAYLFTGPRGTGKTSTARIFAKSLNCQKGITLVPCEECASCIDIKNSNPIDVIEIDAASNRSVEDARNILEKIQYVPVNGKFKIYIIDEVHMLTKEAFNTLLKTLEEPPKNVIFILATTEIQKVLDTIISRCQRFDFRRILSEDIFNHLKKICEQENIEIEDDAIRTIARTASGGMRDALSLLDQVSVLNKKITVDDINTHLGRLSFEILDELFEKIENSDIQGAIEFVEKIYNSGNEAIQILTNLLDYIKNLLIAKNTSNKELLLELTQLSAAQISKLQKHNIENHQLTFLLEKVSYYIKEFKTNTNLQLWLEVAIIDIANLCENTKLIELQNRIERLERGNVQQRVNLEIQKPQPTLENEQTRAKQEPIERIESQQIVKEPKQTNTLLVTEQATKDTTDELETQQKIKTENKPEKETEVNPPTSSSGDTSAWVQLLQNISSQPTVSLLTQHCVPIEISQEQILIGCKEVFVKMISNDTKKNAIADGAKKIFGKSIDVVIKGLSSAEMAEFEKKNKKVIITKHASKPISKPPINQEEVSEEIEEYIKSKQKENKPNEEKVEKPQEQKEVIPPSSQVLMVKQLFNGEIME